MKKGKTKKQIIQLRAKRFEKEVADLFILQGYDVRRNIDIDGNDIDIFAEIGIGPERFKAVIECKNYNRNVRISEVNKFYGLYKALRDKNRVDRGIMVSRQGFSESARRFAERNGMSVYTLDELASNLIDFGFYIERVIYDFENFEEYCTGQRIPIIEDFSNCDLYKFYIDLDCFDAKGREYRPIDQYIGKWLKHKAKNHVSVLGDYGTGKSSFCLMLTYKLAKKFKADQVSSRIPIYISLKEYGKTLSVEQLITGLLLNRYGIQIPNYRIFEKLLESGRFVVLLDGFDEMATKSDRITTIENFRELNKLASSRNKVVLTCRTHYFKTKKDVDEILDKKYDTELMEEISDKRNYDVIYLREFSEKKIRKCLKLHYKDDWKEYLKKIHRTYNLEDLAKRPILLDIIIKTLPKLKETEEINQAKLYQTYTDFWIEREDWRSKLDKDEKRIFAEELAFEMFQEEKYSLNYRDLPATIKNRFPGIRTQTELEHLDYDITTCSFLNRDGEGNYRFIHKSFLEFFVACKLKRELMKHRFENYDRKRIPYEIREFVRLLFVEEKDFTNDLVDRFGATRDIRKKCVLARIMGIAGFSKPQLSKTELENACKENIRLWDISLQGANLESADLSEIDLGFHIEVDETGIDVGEEEKWQDEVTRGQFAKEPIESSNMPSTTGENMTICESCGAEILVTTSKRPIEVICPVCGKAEMLVEATLPALMEQEVEFEDAAQKEYYIGTNMKDSVLSSAKLMGAKLIGANLEGVDLRRADLRGANLEEANLDGADLDGIKSDDDLIESLKNTNWRKANWDKRMKSKIDKSLLPLMINCKSCGAEIEITTSKRPIEVMCPSCGETEMVE